MPETNNRINSIVNEFANPTRPMLIAVMAGVRMTKYLIPVFSARIPSRGLNRAGIRLIISRKAAIDSDIPSLSISSGNNGAKNAEKVSWARWARERMITSGFLNLVSGFTGFPFSIEVVS